MTPLPPNTKPLAYYFFTPFHTHVSIVCRDQVKGRRHPPTPPYPPSFFYTPRTNVRRVDRRSPVRVRGHHHHRYRFDLRGLVWKSSGQCSFRDHGVAAVQFVEPARHDAQKPRGRAKRSDDDDDDDDEADSVGRLTSEEAWLFPVVRPRSTGVFFCWFCAASPEGRVSRPAKTARFGDARWLVSDPQIPWQGMDQLAPIPLLCSRRAVQCTACNPLFFLARFLSEIYYAFYSPSLV